MIERQLSLQISKTPSSRRARRIFSGLALLLLSCLPAWSQQVVLSANDLAKKVDEHYNHLQSLKTNFVEQYDGLGQHRSESGVMMLRKPGRMRWEYSSTPGKVFVLDGKYAWFYAPGDTQVQRIAASQLDDLRSPLRFLLGHTKIESELTGLTLAAGSNGGYKLAGVPKGQQQRIAKLSLDVTAAGTITGIEIDEADGAETRFSFTGEQPNAKIPEIAFHFTPPAGVPVVDALPPV
jgi:outer membrane lipoprotein carrier protein